MGQNSLYQPFAPICCSLTTVWAWVPFVLDVHDSNLCVSEEAKADNSVKIEGSKN